MRRPMHDQMQYLPIEWRQYAAGSSISCHFLVCVLVASGGGHNHYAHLLRQQTSLEIGT